MIAPITTPSLGASSWTQRIWAGVAGLALGALSGLTGGCQFQVPGLENFDASLQDAAAADGVENNDLPKSIDLSRFDLAVPKDASIAADMTNPDDLTVLGDPPVLSLPNNAQTLPPMWAYLYWKDGALPNGRTIADYQACSTTAGLASIDDAVECPNPAAPVKSRLVLNPLAVGATYHWKVRARYDNGNYSAWSAVRTFTTDNSLVGWWHLDASTADASGMAHNVTLQNGAGYGPGRISQALDLDGANDQATAADTPDHDFGTGDFTFFTWIYPLRDGQAEALVTKRTAGNGYELYRTAAGQLAFYGANCGIAVTGGNLPKNAWHHVAAVRSMGNVRLYVDGMMAAAGACADNFANAGSLALGCNGPDIGCVEPFQGRMDEVAARKVVSDDGAVTNELCAGETLAGIDPLPAPCTP